MRLQSNCYTQRAKLWSIFFSRFNKAGCGNSPVQRESRFGFPFFFDCNVLCSATFKSDLWFLSMRQECNGINAVFLNSSSQSACFTLCIRFPNLKEKQNRLVAHTTKCSSFAYAWGKSSQRYECCWLVMTPCHRYSQLLSHIDLFPGRNVI